MLVISRKSGQKIMINDNIVITIVEVKGGQCRIAIDADKDVKIYREEIYYQIKLANLVGKNSNVDSVDSVANLIKDSKVQLNDKIDVKPDMEGVSINVSDKSKTFIIKKQTNKDV